jgi:hypothetical protein
MTMQPITDDKGLVVDEYDDGKAEQEHEQNVSGQLETPGTQQSPSQVASSKADTTLQETSVQMKLQAPSPTSAVMRSEDTTDFDASDVLIQIMLQRADGHPQGRLVSVVIHNFSGQPVIQDFREAELTDKARLDSIHRAIYPMMQRFLLELSARKQKKLEEETKRASRPMPMSQPRTSQAVPATSNGTPTSTTSTTPVVAAVPKPAPQTGQNGLSKDDGKKKEKQNKYQPIPMF